MNYIKNSILEAFAGIDHGFGTASTPWPGDIILLQQKHTNNVVVIDDLPISYLPDADAVLTKMPGITLGVKTADCLPLLVYNPVVKVIGAIHAGWRGLANKIVFNAVDELCTFYKTVPEHSYFVIGPGICGNCYEVGPDVIDSINSATCVKGAFRHTSWGKGLLDNAAIAKRQIEAAGVPSDHISHVNLCTRCSPGFHSHRAGSKERQVSYIKIL
jgi:purine-nucleoside/S-methyl-5'-thioadenosine phosphorylase / adenosine deaminase